VTEIYHSGHPTVAKKRRVAPIRKPYVPRVISFILLLAIILLVGAIFFQVMAQFIVPLFLAGVLLVVFQPLHAWTLNQLPGHPRLCAALTTFLILLVVLLPLTWLGWRAYVDFRAMLAPSGRVAAGHAAPRDQQLPAKAVTANGATDESGDQKAALATRLWKLADDLRHRVEEFTGQEVHPDDLQRMVNRATTTVGSWLLTGVQSAIGILIGLAIMVISLYYFLADGPAMIRAVMHLSPLESRYEKELLERFGQVSRAVVVATLLSAVVQGALAGIGYYFALPVEAPIFLLTALTMVTAMVPFVGAAAVWICVCGWVYLYGERVVDGVTMHDGNWVTALILAVYCTIVVSGIDNVIKPFVLHGQSKLHPLLALLSILGGVTVLGPVGILVGPMLVSFLQALLAMLRKELDSFGVEDSSALQLAAVIEGAAPTLVESAVPLAAEKPVALDTNSGDGARASAAKTPAAPAKADARRGWKRRRRR
jgi:predicted PurR-regulated permease PerM